MKILNNEYSSLPNKIFINGINTTVQRFYTDLESSENTTYNVTLLWNDGEHPQVSQMFQGCSDIIEIDFIEFDTSDINNMDSMFNGCSLI